MCEAPLNPINFILAQAGTKGEDPIVVIAIVGVAVVGIAAFILREKLKTRQIRERELAAYQDRNRVEQVQKDRDGKAYAQHVALNDLQTAKLTLETKLLQAQFDNVERDRHMRDNHEDYHKLMMQKTELEIQSLKLHIREMRKRNEDFGSYDDE